MIKKEFLTLAIVFFLVFPAGASDYNEGEQGRDVIGFKDSMDSIGTWTLDKDQNVSAVLKIVPGEKDKAFRVDYNMDSGNWFEIRKDIDVDLTDMEALEFYYKGGNAVNNIEVKIRDKDGTIYGVILEGASNIPDWKKVQLDFSRFKYMWGGDEKLDLTQIKSISFAIARGRGGKGYILFDDLKIKVKKSLMEYIYTSSVTIDDFEKVNLPSVYLALKEDDSVININSSRLFVKTGDYSMELTYQLSTDKSIPSKVSAMYQADKTLDWNNVKRVNIWVKGDGSGNIFRINLYDLDGDVYSYEDRTVLFSSKWEKISIPLSRFKVPSWHSLKGDRSKLRKKIRTIGKFEFAVVGRTIEDSDGKIYLDEFYATGDKLLPINVVPTETLKIIKLARPQGNVDIKGKGQVEYKYSAEENHLVCPNVNLGFDAAVSKFQVFLELSLEDRAFGDSVYMDDNRRLSETKQKVEASSLRISANNPVDYVENITVGNVWVDYSDYTISQWGWGYKGIQGEGSYDLFNYNLFLLKHKYDSITYGGFLSFTKNDFLMKIIYARYRQTGKRESTGIINEEGEIVNNEDDDQIIETVNTLNDSVVTAECRVKFSKKLTVRALSGVNVYHKIGELNIDNPQSSIFSHYLEEEIEQTGYTYKGQIELRSFPVKDFYMNFHYRDSDGNFKPYFRKDPGGFDETRSDVSAYNLQLSQGYHGYVLSVVFDNAKRKSSDVYYRRWFQCGINKYNYHKIDIGLYEEIKKRYDRWETRDVQGLYSSTANAHEEVVAHIFKIVYHFTSSVELLQELRLENIHLPDETKKDYKAINYFLRFLFFISSTTKLSFETRATKHGEKGWESFHYPYDDNYYKFLFEVNF